MASLETILKLKDSFTNTIHKITNAIDSMANSAKASGDVTSQGIDRVQSAYEKAETNIHNLGVQSRVIMVQ